MKYTIILNPSLIKLSKVKNMKKYPIVDNDYQNFLTFKQKEMKFFEISIYSGKSGGSAIFIGYSIKDILLILSVLLTIILLLWWLYRHLIQNQF